MKKTIYASAAALALIAGAGTAFGADKVMVITSYPDSMTGPIEAAFEKAHPDYDLEVLNKSTSSAVKYLQEIAGKNTADIFWASSPDAFEVLKTNGLLSKVKIADNGIPDKIGSYPMNDPDGTYFAFAASGYGIMWNTRYLKAHDLKPALQWSDLAKPEYYGHVGMSAPSRSGTTHLTVETLLQGDGWDKGWAQWKEIAGNFHTVTERSFGVPDGVNTGQFGLGVVIDFFGFSSKASGFPVEFAYPKMTALVPANIAVMKDAPDEKGALTFINFLRSPEGQKVLFNPAIMRLPINPATYKDAPEGFPNPFEDKSIGASLKFDVEKSGARYNVVNSLFDVMITYRLNDLRAAVHAIQLAEAAQAKSGNAEAAELIKQARALVDKTPIDEAKSLDPAFTSIFTKKRKKATDKVGERQAEIEQRWDAEVVKNYHEAKKLADKAAAM